MKKAYLLSCIFFLAACSLLQSPAAPTPTIGSPVQTPAEPTAAPEPTLPPVSNGVVTGRVCYPSEFFPEMTAYFLETQSGMYYQFLVAENQAEYSIELPAGTYQVFAWRDEFQVGGGYTAYVACGFDESCTDHSLLDVDLEQGEIVSGIDICDWVLTDLPLPESGVEGPEGSADAFAGLIYRTSDGLWQINPSGEHRMLLDRPDALVLSPERFVHTEGDDIWLYDADFSRGGIWLLNADGAGEIYLGQGGAPVWRPDGGGLVYLDSSTGFIRFYDTISLESAVVDFSDKAVQPVDWLP